MGIHAHSRFFLVKQVCPDKSHEIADTVGVFADVYEVVDQPLGTFLGAEWPGVGGIVYAAPGKAKLLAGTDPRLFSLSFDDVRAWEPNLEKADRPTDSKGYDPCKGGRTCGCGECSQHT